MCQARRPSLGACAPETVAAWTAQSTRSIGATLRGRHAGEARAELETFNRTGEVGAIVTGVNNFDDMLEARVKVVSTAAEQAGLRAGMTGAEVLELIR